MKEYLKKLLIRILILIAILIFILLFIEIFTNIFYSNKKLDNNTWYYEDQKINNMNLDKLQNKRWDNNPTWLHIGEKLKKKKKGTKRILIIGDSYIWGHGYSNANEIWWQQFKHLLKQKGYSNVDVVATGLSGYSTKQEYESILQNKKLIKNIDPDLIIIGYVSNDPEFRDEQNRLYIKTASPDDIFYYNQNILTNGIKTIAPKTYKNISTLIYNKFGNTEFYKKTFGYSYNEWTDRLLDEPWFSKYETEVIKPLANYMENDLKIPYFFYVTKTTYEASTLRVEELLNKYNIDYYSAYEIIYQKGIDVSKDVSNHKINPVNYHPSVYECKLFSDELLNILTKSYPEILGTNTSKYTPKININDWMPFSLKPKQTNYGEYIIKYPNIKDSKSFLYLPIKKKYVKLNLEDPYDIKKIIITGEDLEQIEIFINKKNEILGYDDHEMISLGSKTNKFEWNINYKDVTAININAKIKNGNSKDLKTTIK